MFNVTYASIDSPRTFLTSDIAVAQVTVMLRAYLDDSGKFSDPRETAIVVAGAIADLEKWDSFDQEWRNVLDEFGVSELHMVDLAHFRGDYFLWDEEKRRTFLDQLCKITDKYILKPLGGLLPLEQFKRLDSKKKEFWLNDPYFVCLQDSIELAANVAQELFVSPEYVQIICDQQQEFEAKANHVFRTCQKYLPNGDRLKSFGFGASKDFPGLQLADLIAYEALHVRRDMLNLHKNIIDEIRWPMTQLLKKQVDFEFYTEQKLRDRKPLNFQ